MSNSIRFEFDNASILIYKLKPMSKFNILIVDDNPEFVWAFCELLTEAGLNRIETIDVAVNGEDGLDKMKRKFYDFVFLDINMPRIDGTTLCQMVNLKSSGYSSTLIAISFHNEAEVIDRMLNAGAQRYLLKDQIDITSLIDILNSKSGVSNTS
jgi:CheY-like chemotaxis protein